MEIQDLKPRMQDDTMKSQEVNNQGNQELLSEAAHADNIEDKLIKVRGAKEHNLKNVDIDIPRNQLVVITGLSGSGKSSLAFDTIYAEGQRRYVESLSAYARQFLDIQNKPDVESISGLSPAIAIDQKTTSKNPRSTIGTVTEIYDYLRLLFARVGIPYSPATGLPIESQTVSQIVDRISAVPLGTRCYLLAPIIRGRKGEHRKELLDLRKKGYQRVKIDNEIYELDDLPEIDKNKKHNIEVLIDRLVIEEEMGNRLASSVETALEISNGLAIIEIVKLANDDADNAPEKHNSQFDIGEQIIFSSRFACPESGFTISEIEPRLFSFNSPYGACSTCDGLGTSFAFDENLIVPDKTISLLDGAIVPWRNHKSAMQVINALANHYDFSVSVPFEELPEKIQKIILYGSGNDKIEVVFEDGFRTFKTSRPYEGIIPNLKRRIQETDSEWAREDIAKYQNITDCPDCGGYRLKQEALCVKIGGLHIGEICAMPIEESLKWFENIEKKLSPNQIKIGEKILKEIRNRLSFLFNVGLEYLTLARESGSLSGGESQRIRLASQIGSGLTGVLYVLDEPSIGLHQCDNERLLDTLKHLRDLGNSVLVVEHDEDTMREADYLIDMGPGAGVHGGEVVSKGSPLHVASDKNSVTGKYLSGAMKIDVPKRRRINDGTKKQRKLQISGVTTNNLKNISASFPLGAFTCVTGVSGGGKSSLIIHTLYKALARMINNAKTLQPGPYQKLKGLEYIDKIIEIDQSPIGRTPRSNPATYTGAFSHIREWFAKLPESKARGYKVGRFSFNVKGGRCEACQGDGVLKIEMHFLPDVYVQCDTCKGKRYNRETLEIKYRDKSISDVLDMTVDEAVEFFATVPSIKDKLLALQEVGLGYIRIGQSATTLSGGEAQRIKLAKELSKRSTGRTFYILDEPTTGLHSEDIRKLLEVLHKLVEAGNTVLVIEHNLDVIKTADWIVDIGPKGGDKGGYVVAEGTPEEVAVNENSITGKYIAPLLK